MSYLAKGKCPVCNFVTFQRYYPDYREGEPNRYYQCNDCGTCLYRCNVDGRFAADRETDAQEKGTCYCIDRQPKEQE